MTTRNKVTRKKVSAKELMDTAKKAEITMTKKEEKPEVPTISFEQYWMMLPNKMSIPFHLKKEILVVDFKARGANMKAETEARWNELMTIFGYKLV